MSELARAQALQSAALTTEAVAGQQAEIALSLLESAAKIGTPASQTFSPAS